jgi:metal-sulfur cluster biosynthetic enzyme
VYSVSAVARRRAGRGYTGTVPSKDEVIDALRAVEDPELGMDIVELGLLYDVEVEGPKVHVTFSLTSMGCPVGPMIQQQIEETVAGMEGVGEVEPELTWDPPWSPERMSDDAKFVLGFG